jgi:3-methylcrotonyl-CoA carboxylase alpha subunit
MNTRLQVEHPVTEEITGVDLVEWQLRVASGEALPRRQDELAINGWAMEARLYAEDPSKGFLPSIGRLDLFEIGDVEGGRIDTGVEQGGKVTPFYDPMVAKVIAHGETRDNARQALAEMLDGTAIWPVRTNAAFLIAALEHPDFVAGTVDTGLIGRDGGALANPGGPSRDALADAALALVGNEPLAGFRLFAAWGVTLTASIDGEAATLPLAKSGDGERTDSVLVAEAGQVWRVAAWRADGAGHHHAHDGDILSPMPGRVIAVEVVEGQAVTRGQKLLTLEAMKMEHTLTAPFDGVVAQLSATPGAQVLVEALLARIEPDAD